MEPPAVAAAMPRRLYYILKPIYMKLSTTIKSAVRTLALFATGVFATACAMVYDDEGDCSPRYKVRFVYDMNLKFSDAFAAEVNQVTLFVVDDNTDRVVWQKQESGSRLATGTYLMDVDVAPGTYTLIAWCGDALDNTFYLGGNDTKAALHARLTARHTPTTFMGGTASEVDTDLGRLYQGKLDAAVFPDEQGTHVYTIHLTKDTNTVKLVLQNLSGDPIADDEFTYTITEDNGSLNYDNSLMADEELTYLPWSVQTGTAGIGQPASKAITEVNTAVATLSTSRLMADRQSMVRIYNRAGDKVVELPLTDYALLVRDNYGHEMTEQEYLDRQDEYQMVFFLDENHKWDSSQILINSWRIVLNKASI